MRITMRVYRRMLVAALSAALLTAAGFVVALPGALAQQPVPVVDPMALGAPIAGVEKAAMLPTVEHARARAAMVLARQRAVAARQAQVAAVERLRVRIVTVAKNQVGDRYSAGASGPTAFDCSGLTRYVYKVATGKTLPHQSHAQYARVKKVKRAQAKPGDLVFFFRGGAHHVGVYIGKGRMVDAAGYGKGVRISPISGSWWSRTYSGMGRLLPA